VRDVLNSFFISIKEDHMEKCHHITKAILGFTIAVITASSHAASVRVTTTVDNSYALFYGTNSGATNFVGSDFSWPSAEVYNFTLDSDKYLYVVTASDLSTAQGFLGQFENLSSGYKFYSNDPQWQVTATGLGSNAPYTGSAADFGLLNHEIQDANNGGNASSGWTTLTAGPANGASPWGSIGGIDSAARWVWYSSNGDPDPTTPGFNHDEWLVFRIAIAATPDNPVPQVPLPPSLTLFLSAIAALGLWSTASRRNHASREKNLLLA